MVQEKVCLNQCTAAFVCGEVMVKFRKRGGRKMKRILIFFRYYRRSGTGRISEKQAGGCHRQCCHRVWKRLYGCREFF